MVQQPSLRKLSGRIQTERSAELPEKACIPREAKIIVAPRSDAICAEGFLAQQRLQRVSVPPIVPGVPTPILICGHRPKGGRTPLVGNGWGTSHNKSA